MKRRSTSGSCSCGGILAVLIIFYLLFGSLLFDALGSWQTYLKSKNWNTLDANILTAKLVKQKSISGKSINYENSFNLVAKYKYFYKNKERYGTSLFIGEEACYQVDKQREFLEKLTKYVNTKASRKIYINPNNPKETFVFRIPTPGMYIGLFLWILVLAVIFMLSVLIVVAFIDSNKEKKLAEQYPNQEWLLNESWNTFLIKEKSETLIFWGIYLTIFFGLSCPLLFSIMRSTRNIRVLVPILLIGMVLLTFLAIFVMAMIIIHYVKYGNAALILRQIPFDIGNECRCAALLPAKFPNGHPVKTKITCEERKVVKTKEGSSTETTTVFTNERMVNIDTFKRAGKRLVLPIEFEIPSGLPSTKSSSDLSYEWKISISAEVPGIDFSCDFLIPVYEVKNKSLIQYRS